MLKAMCVLAALIATSMLVIPTASLALAPVGPAAVTAA
jgi:hypothetical protein